MRRLSVRGDRGMRGHRRAMSAVPELHGDGVIADRLRVVMRWPWMPPLIYLAACAGTIIGLCLGDTPRLGEQITWTALVFGSSIIAYTCGYDMARQFLDDE